MLQRKRRPMGSWRAPIARKDRDRAVGSLDAVIGDESATHAAQVAHVQEVAILENKIRRLESALASVIAASDEVLIDLQEQQQLAASANPFAVAWGDEHDDFLTADLTSSDLANANRYEAAKEDFFGLTHVDLRARNWLLK